MPKQLSGRRPKLPRQPWQTRAVARARSVVLALGAGPSGFPKQFSRQPPLRSLPSFWRWGVAGRASRNERAKRRDLGRPMAAMAVLSTRSGQVARSLNSGRDRFHTVPYKEVISGQAEPFFSRACRMATLSRPASRSGRLPKPMAVVSRPASLWPFYQEWPLCQD